MSVECYDCDCCGKNGIYEECINYCSKCGELICADCVVNPPDDFDYPFMAMLEVHEGGLDSKYCPFCSGKAVSHKQIIEHLLNKYNLSEEEVVQEILNERK